MQRRGPARPAGADGAGFVRLYVEQREHVITTLRRKGVEANDLEDLAADTFAALYQSLQTGPIPDPVGWLKATARKKAANWRRRVFHSREILTANEDLEKLATAPAPCRTSTLLPPKRAGSRATCRPVCARRSGSARKGSRARRSLPLSASREPASMSVCIPPRAHWTD